MDIKMDDDKKSKSRQLYEIVVRGSDWSAMLLGPLRAQFTVLFPFRFCQFFALL